MPSPHEAEPVPGERMVTILSIDGGGIRGIIPAVILRYLEKKLQDNDGGSSSTDPKVRIVDYFDVIAGTSTGSILTAMLTAPANQESPREARPLFDVPASVDFYKEEGKKIFAEEAKLSNKEFKRWLAEEKKKPVKEAAKKGTIQKYWNQFKNNLEYGVTWIAAKYFLPTYDRRHLQSIVESKLKDIKLDKTITDVVVPAFSIDHCRPFVFSTNQKNNVLLKDVVLSSSAAPTYFPEYTFSFRDKRNMTFVDGGLAANNPALLGLSEASKLHGIETNYRNYLVLSLGTGRRDIKIDIERELNWGIAQWLLGNLNDIINKNQGPLLFELLSTSIGDMVELYMARLFQSRDAYLRIQDYELKDENASLDDVTPQNLNNLEKIGEQLLEGDLTIINPDTGVPEKRKGYSYKKALDKFAEKLFNERKRRQQELAQKKGTS